MEENAPELADPSEKLILLVDDDESLLELMEIVVKKEGFRVDRAIDGPEALRKAEAVTPDLIMLDLMLPGKGGYEVARDLQMTDAGRVPIIMVTGRTMDPKTMEMLRQEPNVREFMAKPIRPAVLTASLHAILKTRPPEINRRPDSGPLSGGIR